MLLVRTLCQIMDQLQPKKGDPLEICFWFFYILLILCLPTVSNKYNHGTGAYRFPSQQKVVIVNFSWYIVVSDHGTATDFFGFSIFY